MKDNSKLFIDTPQFIKTAYKRVGDNPSDWTADVMEAFYNQFPFFVNSKVSVDFSQKDEGRGYAIGQITVEEGPGLIVPIIIKDKELFPFDVAIANGNTMPLTNTTIQMFVENKGAFWKLVAPDAGDTTNALFNTSFSQSITPTYMHETYKQAEFDTETIDEKMTRTTLQQKLVNVVSANPHPEDRQLSGILKSKEVLPQDLTVKNLVDQAAMGGQIKANEIYSRIIGDYNMRRSDSLLYILLAFKKAMQEMGIKTHDWNILEKTAASDDTHAYFFPDDINFLAKHLDLSPARIHSIKKHEPEKFDRVTKNVKRAIEMGQDPKSLFRDGEGSLTGPVPMGSPSLSSRTEAETGLNQSKGPALGETWSTKKGDCDPRVSAQEKLNERREWVAKHGPELKNNIDEHHHVNEFISKISTSITEPMKVAFFDVLQKDEAVVEGFKRNKNVNFILKVAAITPKATDFTDKVRQELDRDIQYIYKSGAHEYTGIFGNSVVNDPIRITLNEDQAKNLEQIKVSEFSPSMEIEKTAHVKYAFAVNERKYVVLPNNDFIELEPGVSAPVQDDGLFKYAAETLNVCDPQVSKYATWISALGFTNPFETIRVWESDGREYVETWTGIEKKAYCRMKGIDAPYEENGITYLPANAQFVKLGNKVEVPERLVNDLQNYTIVKTGTEYYHLDFTGEEKHYNDTVWELIQRGARKTDIEKLASLKVGDRMRISYELREPHSLEKISSIMGKSYEKDADTIIDVAKDFIKEAATFNDSPTVDTILSLNFVNKNNILEFVQALPLFAQTSQKLADMLLKCRLGVSLIDEGAIRRVMLGLVEVMDILNGVQNLVEKK